MRDESEGPAPGEMKWAELRALVMKLASIFGIGSPRLLRDLMSGSEGRRVVPPRSNCRMRNQPFRIPLAVVHRSHTCATTRFS